MSDKQTVTIQIDKIDLAKMNPHNIYLLQQLLTSLNNCEMKVEVTSKKNLVEIKEFFINSKLDSYVSTFSETARTGDIVLNAEVCRKLIGVRSYTGST